MKPDDILNHIWNACREAAEWDEQKQLFMLPLPFVAGSLREAERMITCAGRDDAAMPKEPTQADYDEAYEYHRTNRHLMNKQDKRSLYNTIAIDPVGALRGMKKVVARRLAEQKGSDTDA